MCEVLTNISFCYIR